jgi:hypothetical protein
MHTQQGKMPILKLHQLTEKKFWQVYVNSLLYNAKNRN